VKTGVQGIYKHLKILDSGFRRNDGKGYFQTFYEFIKYWNIGRMGFSEEKRIAPIPVYILSHHPIIPISQVFYSIGIEGLKIHLL
jgi:hypothetical protein